jgi:Zinc-ribbon
MCKVDVRPIVLDMPEQSPLSFTMIVPGSTESPPCHDGTCWGDDDELTAGMIRRRFIGLVLTDERRTNAEKQALIEKLMLKAGVWESLARQIEELPIPTAVETMVDIHCSDCGGASFNRKWHFMGVQCPTCTSFDTTILPVAIDKGK